MADANTATTLCWHCSEPYPIGDESCPACNATNGNIDPEQAQAEAKGAGNVDHEWKFQDDLCRKPGCTNPTAGPVLAFCKEHGAPPVPFA